MLENWLVKTSATAKYDCPICKHLPGGKGEEEGGGGSSPTALRLMEMWLLSPQSEFIFPPLRLLCLYFWQSLGWLHSHGSDEAATKTGFCTTNGTFPRFFFLWYTDYSSKQTVIALIYHLVSLGRENGIFIPDWLSNYLMCDLPQTNRL